MSESEFWALVLDAITTATEQLKADNDLEAGD